MWRRGKCAARLRLTSCQDGAQRCCAPTRKEKIERRAGQGPPLQMKWRKLFGGGGVVVAGAGIGRSGRGPAAGSALLLLAGFANERFAREANLVALDGKHLNEDLV